MRKAILKHSPLVADQSKAVHAITKTFDLVVKLENGEDAAEGFVAGWASTPELDLYRHVVATGAFADAIQKRGLGGPQGIKFLRDHDSRKVIGEILKLEYRGERLWMEAQIDLEISYARDLWRAIKINKGLNFSVGFYLEDYSFKQLPDKSEYLHITKGDLFEVSVVTFPGNEGATMELYKSISPTIITEDLNLLSDFEKLLVSKGLAKSRNDAREITLAVKKNIALFQSNAPAADDETEDELEPAVVKSFDSIMAQLAEFKSLLSKT